METIEKERQFLGRLAVEAGTKRSNESIARTIQEQEERDVWRYVKRRYWFTGLMLFIGGFCLATIFFAPGTAAFLLGVLFLLFLLVPWSLL